MRFGEVFGKSWTEYSSNWKVFLQIIFLFVLVPSAILSIALSFSQVYPSNLSISIAYLLISILVVAISLFAYAGITYESFNNKKGKFTFGGIMKGGKKFFWRYLLFVALLTLIFIGISVILIAPFALSAINLVLGMVVGIISVIILVLIIIYLSVKWFFGPFFLIGENKGIIESFSKSFSLVKGKWWKIFGYMVLLGLIIIGIGFVISVPFVIITLLVAIPFSDLAVKTAEGALIYPINIQIVLNLINTIADFVVSAITLPLGVIFGKNLFLVLKNKK